MDSDKEAMGQTLNQLEAQLNGTARLTKGLADLESSVDDLRERVDGNGASHSYSMGYIRQELDDVKRELRALRNAGVSKDHLSRVMSDIWDKMDEKRELTEEEVANKVLAKSVASFLSDNPTREEARQKTLWVFKSFGRYGGKLVNYNKELAGRLLMTKSISSQKNEHWKKYNLLPGDVTLNSAGRAQPQADQAMLYAHALAAMNVSPLFLQHWLRTH